jgi:Conserved hypothetical ATP binding protein
MEKVKFFFRKTDLTGFKPIRECLFMFLDFAGSNTLRSDFFDRILGRIAFIVSTILPFVVILSAVNLIHCYCDKFNEVTLAIDTLLVMGQILKRKLELFVHRHEHRKMMETVEEENFVFMCLALANVQLVSLYSVLDTKAFVQSSTGSVFTGNCHRARWRRSVVAVLQLRSSHQNCIARSWYQ